MEDNYISAIEPDTLMELGLGDQETEGTNQELDDITLVDIDDEGDVVDTAEDGAEVIAEDDTNEDTEPIDDSVEIESLHIDGIGDVSIDEIIEWQKGYLRQSDYTRKTQEIAQTRKDNEEALNVYNYLRNNPHLIEVLQQAEGQPNPNTFNSMTPENQLLQQTIRNQKTLELELKLRDLRDKYGEFDEVSLLDKATELRTEDLDSVYKMISYDANKVNQQDLFIQAKEQAKKELLAEIESNKDLVSTTVSSKSQSVEKPTATITSAEKRVADGMGLSYIEYVKWRDN